MSEHQVILVGAGDMGGHHARAWQEIGVLLAAVVDMDAERRERLADQHHVPMRFASLNEALAGVPAATIVDIAVPLKYHAELTILAAQAKKHVLCEKPIARTLAEVDAMEEAIRQGGVKFAVGFQRNLSPGVQYLREEVERGLFGRPLLFTAEGFGEVRPKRFMHDANDNNGPVVDLLGHYFLLWESVFASAPVRIDAQGFIAAHHRPEIAHFAKKAIDTAVVNVGYASGDVGTMTVSWGLAQGTRLPAQPERLIGPRAVAVAGPFKNFTWEGFTIHRGDAEEFHALPMVNPFALQAQAFIDYVDGVRGKPASSLSEGRHLLRLSLAALEAIETGRAVQL